jgi:3-dehydroquinate dehydratase/shikimate dehydrogenase
MTHLCVAIFVRDLTQARRDIALAAEAGADMVELRVDAFGTEDADMLKSLLRFSPVPVIITCRSTSEGGDSDLDDEQRIALLESLSEANPAYIDVELDLLRRRPDARTLIPRQLIVSAHDFQTRPPRLQNLVLEMNQSPGGINKVVWMARTVRDNLEAFELVQHRAKPTVALCMGEAGLISRVLAKKFNAFLTFASLTSTTGTAPGQVSIEQMKRLYRWDALNAKTKVYGVVGSPIAHSMSPAIHNAAFDETGHDGIYLPLLVNEGYESFKAFMESFLAFESLDLSGLSITIPHKENALKYLQEKDGEIDPLAARIGAVNTIVINRSESQADLRGFNSDYAAILDSITERLAITRERLGEFRVAVIGAGGTGRTAVAALAHYGATVVVYNRTRDRADALAVEFNGKTGKVVAAPLEKLCDSCCQIYVNTTSVGMHPNIDASPFGNSPPKLSPDVLVFDAVYNPIRTRLLREAEAAGAKAISGVEMFVRQAAMQFEAWTHLPAPVDVMKQIVEARLSPSPSE